MYLNLKSKALYDLRRYEEAREAIFQQQQQQFRSSNPGLHLGTSDSFLMNPEQRSREDKDPSGVCITSDDIIPPPPSPPNSAPPPPISSTAKAQEFTQLMFESNDILCQLKLLQHQFSDPTNTTFASNLPLSPSQLESKLEALLQAFPRYTPLWKASIYSKLNQLLPSDQMINHHSNGKMILLDDLRKLIKHYNNSIK